MTENELAKIVVDAAFQIHTALGPGLLESVYETVLEYSLIKRGLQVNRQRAIPVVYEGVKLEDGFRADLIVNGTLLIEIKSTDSLADVHFKQVLTYLRLSGIRLGLLINFNTALFKDGVKRVANGMPD